MSGLEIIGIGTITAIVALVSVFVPRVVLGVIAMWALGFPLWAFIPLAFIGLVVDIGFLQGMFKAIKEQQ